MDSKSALNLAFYDTHNDFWKKIFLLLILPHFAYLDKTAKKKQKKYFINVS
jgi:hypothetical protein